MREKIIRNYYINIVLISLALVAAVAAAVFCVKNVWVIAAVIVIGFALLKLADSFLGYKYFLSILFIEKDARKFSEAMKPSKYFSPSAHYRMLAAYYSGNHAETVNICTKMMKGDLKPAQRLLCATVLARTYFELGDDEKLATSCRYFTAYADAMQNGEKLRAKFPVMEFFKQYLGGNLDACEEAAEKGKAEEIRAYVELALAQSKFFRAVANYRLGDKAKAQVLFEEVIYEAPKTHFARMAHTYLDAIALEDPELLQNSEVLPDENYEIYGKAMRVYLKWRIPLMVFCACVIILNLTVLYFWL